MSEPEPPAEPAVAPPPRASRAAPKTVRVRRDGLTPEPSDEPTGPPGVLFWFRLACAVVAVAALVYVGVLSALMYGPSWDGKLRAQLVLVAVFVAYSLPFWWRRPAWWHWIYGLAVMLTLLIPPVTPVGATLLVFWFMPRTVRFFRHPPPSYVAPPPPVVEGAAAATPPGALFALRWMCVMGCVACLLALPVVGLVHAADPKPGWDVLWWLGGCALAFVLFAVPLFARTPRPWVWWYGLGLLAVCSLSLYFTLLAVPILMAWLLKRPRGYFAGDGLARRAAA